VTYVITTTYGARFASHFMERVHTECYLKRGLWEECLGRRVLKYQEARDYVDSRIILKYVLKT